MARRIKKFVSGDKTWEISLFNTSFKNTMIQLLQGYPLYVYYGIWETYFEKEMADNVIGVLEKDNFLEVREKENGQKIYRLTADGVRLATTLVSLDYSQKTNKFTEWIIGLTITTLFFGIAQLISVVLFKLPIIDIVSLFT